MNCQDYEDQLGDYIDGTLAATLRAEVEAHLHACAPCRLVVEDFQAIRAMTRELEPLTPSPRVWQAIAAATAGPPHPRWWSRPSFAAWQPALASAMAVVVGTGLWWIGGALSDAAGSDRFAAVATTASASSGLDADTQAVEADYAMAIVRLEQIAGAERSALDQETMFVLDAGLTVIDDAIDESRMALETEPESSVAQDSLFAALRRKVAVLQEMLALINETRQGNEDAAGMRSELNP